MVTITSTALQEQFGRYRELAQREPVSITAHGRESLVLLSAEEYRRLKALDAPRAYYAHELPDAIAAALDVARAPAADADHDHEYDR